MTTRTIAARYPTHTWFRIALAAVALLQIGVLMKGVFDRQSLLTTGREIITAVEPVDPRDLFRGDYVILGYNFSRIKKADIAASSPFENLRPDDNAYITLRKGEGNVWFPISVEAESPGRTTSDSDVVIKGRVSNRWWSGNTSTEANFTYGIERYYVPEGTGKALEQKVRDKTVEAILAVGPDGTAAIKGIIVGGERHVDPPLF